MLNKRQLEDASKCYSNIKCENCSVFEKCTSASDLAIESSKTTLTLCEMVKRFIDATDKDLIICQIGPSILNACEDAKNLIKEMEEIK
ncbi:hypothetical protein [Dehalobacter sp. 14DCB1]|uniref:hypothetical protein n=1 Tax=Dehalobacter sp. 14DCB1 TaxID=2070227 RepID=UPI00104ED39C|nr:hypothetical protein [Dehalobacter sp. 14DCB1]TCX53812.1 hypothetical protein C1I36_03520 [Dehalobacter sp. 14DCB1]